MIRLSLRDKIYYHGTSLKENADGILQYGLKPLSASELAKKYYRKEAEIPMAGGVYLTSDMYQAFRYAFWFKGAEWKNHITQEPYGYIFIFDSESISDYLPDEDEIGYIVHGFFSGHIRRDVYWLFEMAKEEMEKDPEMADGVREGLIGDLATLGKRIIPKLNKEQIDQIALIGHNLVSKNGLRPSAYYKVKKPTMRISPYDTDGYTEYMKQPNVMERVDLD